MIKARCEGKAFLTGNGIIIPPGLSEVKIRRCIQKRLSVIRNKVRNFILLINKCRYSAGSNIKVLHRVQFERAVKEKPLPLEVIYDEEVTSEQGVKIVPG